MRKNQYIKAASNLCIALAFISALLLIINKTHEYKSLAQTIFFLFGGAGIILSMYLSFALDKNKEFNWLFWVGTVVIFCAITFKLLHWQGYQFIILVGAGITGLSYFINPFAKKEVDEEADDLLDQ